MNSRDTEGGHCASGNVLKRLLQITAHVDARQDAGHGGEKQAEYGEERFSWEIFRPGVVPNVHLSIPCHSMLCRKVNNLLQYINCSFTKNTFNNIYKELAQNLELYYTR